MARLSAFRALLSGIVDYAGLFPPASLDMPQALTNYAEYAVSDDAWMLGRFVVPVARLEEVGSWVDRSEPTEWKLAGLLGEDLDTDVARVLAFNRVHAGGPQIDTLEGKFADATAIQRAAAAMPAGGGVSLFAEVAIADDPRPLIDAMRHAGVNAKVRTGGVTPGAFPRAEDLVRFMQRCADRGVPFKATAGLHHPVRAEYRLTYAPGAPRGFMFGYLNVFLAAALLAGGVRNEETMALLGETSAEAFVFDEDAIGWRSHRFTAERLDEVRRGVAVSFGSCSFREPVEELRALVAQTAPSRA